MPRTVFLVFFAIYLLTWGGHYTSGDGAQKIAWAKAMLHHGSADIDPGPGVAYSKYGVGHSLLAIVPLTLSEGFRRVTGIQAEAAWYTLMFVINGALFLALLASYLGSLYPQRTVWVMVSLIGLATTWWPFTKLDYSEPLILTGMFGAFLLLRRGHAGWGMLVAGLVSTVRQDALLLVAVLGLWHIWRTGRTRDVTPMAVALLPAIVIHALANSARYGSVLIFGYEQEFFDTPLLVGLYGILLSAGKSVFLFSPPLVAGVWAWRRFAASADRWHDAVLFATVFVVQLVLYAGFWAWSSDDSWGVRFMIPGVILMCIPMVELLSRRVVVATVAAVGVFVQILAVSVGPLDYVLLLRSAQPVKQQYYGFDGHAPLGPDDLWYHPRYSQLVGNWLLLRTAAGYPPAPQSERRRAAVGTALYDTLPPEAWTRAARWDFIWPSLIATLRGETASPPPTSNPQ